MNKLVDLIFELWVIVARLLIIWLIVVLFIPGIDWFEHTYMLVLNLISYPSGIIFDFFTEYHESVLVTLKNDSIENPIEIFVNLLLLLGGIACSLALPVAYWVGWLGCTVLAVMTITPKPIRAVFSGGWTPEAANNWHLLSGRTTVQDTYDAEVQANAIASALNKHR